MNRYILVSLAVLLIIVAGCTSIGPNDNEQEVKELVEQFKIHYNNNDVQGLKSTLSEHNINKVFKSNNFASREPLSEATLIDFKREIGYKMINSMAYKDIDVTKRSNEEFAIVEVVINNEADLYRTTQFNIFKESGGWKIAWINKPQVLDKFSVDERIAIAQKTQQSRDAEFQ